MKQFLLYGHGGAYNHGAEAIIKCTVKVIKKLYPGSRIALSTHFMEQDLEFGLPVDEYCRRDQEYLDLDRKSPKKGMYDDQIYRSTLDKISKDTICLSVGGDNYCYDNWRRWKLIHETALKQGARSILWSCSIEPSAIDGEMIDVLKSHHLITARESITYEALKNSGIENVVHCSDVAFLLEPAECPLPDDFVLRNTVALNMGPLIARREGIKGILVRNAESLIGSIIKNTDMNVALIPHVLMPMDNDLEVLKELYLKFRHSKRVCLISKNLSAAEYKYLISKCRFGIFSRTHASIAAYSSCVPTMVIGYSVKSIGIARDLGLEEYVMQVKDIKDECCMVSMFKKLMDDEQRVRQTLADKMKQYKEMADKASLL